jgi:microcystin-dependent protein
MNFLQPKILWQWPARTGYLALLLLALGPVSRAGAQSSLSVTSGPAIALRSGQALVSGIISSNQETSLYWFEHGPTSSYGHSTPTNSLPAGTDTVTVSNLLTSLPRGSAYHFRLVASNSLGVVAGGNVKFTTRGGSNVASSATGGGQPVDLRQPSLELNYIICTAGPYPTPESSVQPPFIGQVQLFAGNFAPVGWLFCHGQLVNITAYESLFNLIGTTYGGDGQTTFAIPDFRGRTIVGKGPGPEGFTRVVGERGGSNQITFSTTNLALHNHSLPPPDANGSGYTGGGQSYSNLQPYLVMYAGIYRAGIFPFPDQDTDEPMLGQINFFAGQQALNNPFPASGQLLPINQNQALFALLGTNYGGNGITSFGLPNLNGRTPMGIGAGPGPSNWALAAQPGLVNPTLNASQLPAHEHAVTGLGINTGSTGSGQPVSLMKPTLAVRYIICANGAFPARPFAEGGAIPKAAGDQLLGQINLFAGTFVPAGWLACDGQLLSIPNYVGLFSLLGTNFGGNGTNNFALPDLSSRIPVGSSNGQPGATYGAQQTVLTTAQMPAHTHLVPALDFDRWITSYGLSGFGAGFDGDADGDSIKNGFEWATGSNPTNANSFKGLAISSLGDDVLIRFPRNTNATDLRLALQRTGELTSSNEWTGIASNNFGAWVSPAAPVTVQETGATNPLTVTISDRRTNFPTAIYRLRVE